MIGRIDRRVKTHDGITHETETPETDTRYGYTMCEITFSNHIDMIIDNGNEAIQPVDLVGWDTVITCIACIAQKGPS